MANNFSTRLKDNYLAKAIFSNLWLKSFLIASVLFVFCWISFGMYFEDNEAIVAALNYGVLGKVSNEQFFSNFHAFLLPVLYKLSIMLPKVPVYGIFKISFVLLIYTVLIKIVLAEITILPNSERKYATAVLMLLCFILVSDSQLHLHCIRHSIILSFAALLLNYQSVEKYGKTSLAAVAIFFIAVNTRSHSSAIIMACFGLFLLLSGTPFTKVIKHYWAMVLIAFAFLAVYQVYGNLTINIGKYFEAHYEYALIEKPSLYPLSNMKTAKDTVKYEAVTQFFLSDSIEINIPFIDRVANITYEHTPIFVKEKWLFALNEIVNKANHELPMLSLLLIAGCLLCWKSVRKQAGLKTIAIIACGLMVLFMLLVVLVNDMKPRFFVAFCAMIIFCIFLFQLPIFWNNTGRYMKGLLVLAFSVIAVFQFKNLSAKATYERNKEANTQIAMQKLHNIASTRPVLIFMGSDIPFSSNPFFASNENLYPYLATFDAGYMVYYSFAQERFQTLFGVSPVNFPALIQVLKKRNDIVFYIEKERFLFINNYFEMIYKIRFELQPIQDAPIIDENAKFYSVNVIDI